MIARHHINARDQLPRIYCRTTFDSNGGLADFVQWLHAACADIMEITPTRIVLGCDVEGSFAPRVVYLGPKEEMVLLVAVARWYLRESPVSGAMTAAGT